MTEETLFSEALKLPPNERGEFLAKACDGNQTLQQRMEALLSAYNPIDSFLEAPATNGLTGPYLPGAASSHLPGSSTEKPGSRIGPYRLLEQIGEGGFGVVFMAEQHQPIRRKVALKIVKPGMDTRQVVARFEAERQALAIMDHPHIAHVFDGGETESGRPYFVMELVRGIPITDFCDQDHVPIRERLELFINVCQAVQHAHQKGIIHRDLKPSNILITLHDGTPVVKVIDFGIAKATGQQLTDKTLFTNFAQFIGTPMYMSPEQAALSGLDVDTRSDIYALGVLLYELLAGTTPFDKEKMRTAAYDEIRRIIREEEPLPPSTRLTTLGTDSGSISTNRRSDPKQLSQILRGELDWIVLKALEKDRNRRYETVSAFAADVQRYLRDEPVLACPPTLSYRLQKIMSRHKGPVLAGTVIVLALLGGIIGTTWGMLRATKARAEAVWASEQKEEALIGKVAALDAALKSERNATDQLYQSLMNQARAGRMSNRIGQRFHSLQAIRRAAQIRITPELRAEAAAALILPDLEVVREWVPASSGYYGRVFDAKLERYASLDKNGGLTISRLKDGGDEVIARLPAQGEPLFRGLVMSADGRFVAYGHSGTREGLAGSVRVWNVDGPAPRVVLDEPAGLHEQAIGFHPNSKKLALGHADGFISVYDLITGRRVHRLSVETAPVHLAFHPRDSRLAVACGNVVRIFDTDNGQECPSLKQESRVTWISCLAWHPDGRRLAVAGNDRKIHIWDVNAIREVMPAWTGHVADGLFLSFSPSGDRLMSGDWSNVRRLWNADSGHVILNVPKDFAFQFGRDETLIEASIDGMPMRIWKLAPGREVRLLELRGNEEPVESLNTVFHPNGRLLAVCSPLWLGFFDLLGGGEIKSIQLPRRHAVRPICFDPSGGLITGGFAGLLHWPARVEMDRSERIHLGPPVEIVDGLATGYSAGAGMSKDGQVLVVADGHNGSVLIDRRRPMERRTLGPQYDVRHVAVSPDGRLVVTCSWFYDGRSKSVRVWDTDTAQQLRELPIAGATTAKFSPDGRWLATSGGSGSRIWEVATWREVNQANGSIAFSPDNRLMAVGDAAGVIRLIDIESSKEIARLTGQDTTSPLPICFSPDQGMLITSYTGKACAVWNLRLIRAQLKELGLDWDWPEIPPANSGGNSIESLKVELHLGDLDSDAVRDQMAQRAIEQSRAGIAANPKSAVDCNTLAWLYVTGPPRMRDVKAAIPLAELAVQINPNNALYVNTLGVAYYRDGQYRRAIDVLRPNLQRHDDASLAFDLYFLAMAHQQLGESERARDYFDWAVRWTRTQRGLTQLHREELDKFHIEAERLFKTN